MQGVGQLAFDALLGRVSDDERCDLALKYSGYALWDFAILCFTLALWVSSTSPPTALDIYSQAFVACAVAWRLPSSRSRVLSCWLILQAVAIAAEVAGAVHILFGAPMTPALKWFFGVWSAIQLLIGTALFRLTFDFHRRHRTEIAPFTVLVGTLAAAALFIVGRTIALRPLPPPGLRLSPGAAEPLLEAAIRIESGFLLPVLVFILFVVPRLGTSQSRSLELREDDGDAPLFIPSGLPILGPPPEPAPGPKAESPADAAPMPAAPKPAAPKPDSPADAAPMPAAPKPEQPPAPLALARPSSGLTLPLPLPTPTAGARGPSIRVSSAVAQRPRPPGTSKLVPVGIGTALVGLLALGILRLRSTAAPPTPAPATVPIAVEPPAPKPIVPSPELPKGAIINGRSVDWWTQELRRFHANRDPRYAVLRARAEASGLSVEEENGALSVTPLPTFVKKVFDRFAGTRAAAPAVTPEDERLRRADVEAVLEALERDFATNESPRKPPRGPAVILAPRPGPTAAIRIQFAAGSYHDRDLVGITRLSQHVMIMASAHETYQSFLRDLDASDGKLAFETGVSESAITLEAPASEFEGLARRLLAMCLRPRPVPSRLEVVKAAAVGRRNDENLDELTNLLAEMTFHSPGFANNPMGDEDVVRSLTIEDVSKHLAGSMAPANATVVIAGNFNPARFRAALAGFQGGAPVPFERPREELPGTYAAEARIILHIVAYPISATTEAEVAAAHLSAAIMEEELLHRFRDLGVAYTVQVVPEHRPWLDFILIVIPFGDTASPRIGGLIESTVSGMFTKPLDEERVTRVRRRVIDAFDRVNRTPGALAKTLANGRGPQWVGPYVAREVATMGTDRLQQIVRPWVEASQAVHLNLEPQAPTDPRGRGGR